VVGKKPKLIEIMLNKFLVIINMFLDIISNAKGKMKIWSKSKKIKMAAIF